MAYLLFKFIHIVAVIVWIGGVIILATLNLRLARSTERPALIALAGQSEFLGGRLIGPAAGLALLTGFAIVGVGRLSFPLWVLWGLSAFLLSMIIGGTLVRRTGQDLSRRLARDQADGGDVESIRRRLAALQGLNLLLLLSAVWAMVFKPTL